jgi:hypothetical protein
MANKPERLTRQKEEENIKMMVIILENFTETFLAFQFSFKLSTYNEYFTLNI